MRFELNFKSAKPVYVQLVDQVKAAVASGAVRHGDALPSIRPLAEELRVNRNTIAKAYTELEHQGVITKPPIAPVSAHHARPLVVECPTRNQILHGLRVVACT